MCDKRDIQDALKAQFYQQFQICTDSKGTSVVSHLKLQNIHQRLRIKKSYKSYQEVSDQVRDRYKIFRLWFLPCICPIHTPGLLSSLYTDLDMKACNEIV